MLRVTDADRTRLDSMLNESAVNLRDRSAAWQKTGWKSFDPASPPKARMKFASSGNSTAARCVKAQVTHTSSWIKRPVSVGRSFREVS